MGNEVRSGDRGSGPREGAEEEARLAFDDKVSSEDSTRRAIVAAASPAVEEPGGLASATCDPVKAPPGPPCDNGLEQPLAGRPRHEAGNGFPQGSQPLSREALLGMIEHDIRTASTVIRGYTRMLLDERVGSLVPEQRRFVCETRRASERISLLLDNLLEVAAFKCSGAMQIKHTRVPLHSTLASALAMVQPLSEERAQCVELAALAERDHVLGDPDYLERVFVNLIQNAIKFGPQGSQVRVVTDCVDLDGQPGIRVSVEDQGPGVAVDEADRIFQPFVRGEAAQPGSAHGIGLGLPICRWVVDAHGGSVQVATANGGGCFQVTLPLEP